VSAAAAIAAYHDRLAEDDAAAREWAESLEAAFRSGGVTFDGAPMRSFLRPHLIDRGDWEALRGGARRLLELLVRLARRAFDGDVRKLCDYLGTPDAEARYVALDPGQPDVLWSRLDAFVTPVSARYIEVNSDAPAGFGYGDRMARLFQELPVFRELAARFRVSYPASAPSLVDAVAALHREAGGRGGLPRVAIVDFATVKTRADQELLREAFLERGLACVLADPRECEVRGGRLYAGGFETDVVYRRALLSELLACESEVSGFLAAYLSRAAVFVNSFRCRLSEDKALFALVTDEAFAELLTAEERGFVERHVPWTRKLEERRTVRGGRAIELVPCVLAERERLVLKPTHAYGGREVLIGAETDARAWAEAVQRGLGGPFVVQEREAIPEEPFPIIEEGSLRFVPLKLNANPFYVRGADVGAVARASRASVINVSAGGGSVPTFVVD
jgi:uncharacterized circularly permuted ATP-grasp superfamily protein